MKQTATDETSLQSAANPRSRRPLAAWLRQVGAAPAVAAIGDLLDDEALFVVDGDQRVVFWSAGAEHMLGFTPDQIVGEHCLKANRCASCIQGCGLKERGQVRGTPLTMHDQHDQPVKVTKRAQGFFDDDGRFLGGIEILTRAPPTPAVVGPAPTPPELGEDTTSFGDLITRDAAMAEVLEVARSVAPTDVTVLIRGESGTGKELFARALHEHSTRKEGPFVAVNCAALSPTLLESQLFGHEKGSFTGASHQHTGVFEQANHGTLFLDEVAELPLDLQAKLLRVLQERNFVRVGGTRPIDVDVRVLAATHRSLRAAVKEGRFREDLMYRLRVVPIFIPPLRERRADVAPLVRHLLARLNRRGPSRQADVTPGAMRALMTYAWPGNVRELENALEYARAVGRSRVIDAGDLPPEVTHADRPPPPPSTPPSGPVPNRRGSRPGGLTEEQAIVDALEASGGHVGQAAEALGMSRATFWRRRKALGL